MTFDSAIVKRLPRSEFRIKSKETTLGYKTEINNRSNKHAITFFADKIQFFIRSEAIRKSGNIFSSFFFHEATMLFHCRILMCSATIAESYGILFF